MPLMEERSVHLFDYLAVLQRRRWWLIVPIVLGVIIGGLLVLLLPREYQSSTTLAVTSPTMATDLVKSSANDLTERLRAIQHELLSRPVLERVARDEGLAERSTVEGAIASIRSRTIVSLPKTLASGTRSGPDTFLVTYTGIAPDETQRVANRLATAFLEEHSKLRETRAEDTSAFLGSQLSQSQERLKTIEERLRKMKEAYMGRLPEQTDANLQMVAGLRQQQETTSMSLRSEQDRLAMIERQIEAMTQGTPDAPMARSGGGTAQERLVLLRQQLDEASTNYTEKHPEIQRLRGEITATEAQAKAEMTRPAADRQPALNASPAYRQLLAEREATRLRIRDHERSIARASSEMSRYQGRVETAPMIEQQLSSVNREYEFEKTQYTNLAERHQSALLAEDLERRRAGEQFAVLYPAYLPSRPSSPNVPRLLLFAILGGVLVGGGLVFAREYVDRSVYDARVVHTEFELPILAEIPRIAGR